MLATRRKGSSLVIVVRALLLLACFSYVADAQCSFSSNGNNYNFSALTTTNGYSAINNGQTYYWNYCAPVPNSLVSTNPCQGSWSTFVSNTSCFGLASTQPNSVSTGEGAAGQAGLTMNVTSDAAKLGVTCMITHRIVCAPDVEYSFRNIYPTVPACRFIIAINSKYGCPIGYDPAGKPSGGLSGGSIFLIIFFVVVPVYLVGGSVFKWKVQGAPVGVDMIPQVEYWVQLPGLIIDGCRFTKDKFLSLIGRSSTHERI